MNNFLSTNTYFTSDTHWYHGNIIKHTERLEFCSDSEKDIIRFGSTEDVRELQLSYESIARMNETLINRWNSVVPPDGNVFFLGDFALKCNVKQAREIRDQLNGKIYFIRGNHDQVADQIQNCFEWYKRLEEIQIQDPTVIRGVQEITLCHYAMKVWNKSHHGTWCLYGHSHHTLPDDPNSRSLDVGVDGPDYNYTPLSYIQIQNLMNKKTFKPIDHHNSK